MCLNLHMNAGEALLSERRLQAAAGTPVRLVRATLGGFEDPPTSRFPPKAAAGGRDQ